MLNKKRYEGMAFSIREELHKEVMKLKKEHPHEKDIQWKIQMLHANIPREFWHIELKNFKGRPKTLGRVHNYCKKMHIVKRKGFGFIFFGGYGVGKTSLQMIILKEAIRRGYSAFYITLSEIFQYLYMGWDYPPLLKELGDILKNTTFLGLGEVGRDYHRKGSETFVMSTFDNFFRFRRSRCLPTSIDTNLQVGDLEGTYGNALISLFSSRLKLEKVRGKDFRMIVQQQEWNKVLEDGK